MIGLSPSKKRVVKSEGWYRLSTPFVFKYHECLSECTIRLMYALLSTTITLRELVGHEIL